MTISKASTIVVYLISFKFLSNTVSGIEKFYEMVNIEEILFSHTPNSNAILYTSKKRLPSHTRALNIIIQNDS
jgi:hypothetical protein